MHHLRWCSKQNNKNGSPRRKIHANTKNNGHQQKQTATQTLASDKNATQQQHFNEQAGRLSKDPKNVNVICVYFFLKDGPCSMHVIIIEIATLRCIINVVVWQICIQMTPKQRNMLMFAFIVSFGGLQITSDVCLQRISF